MSQATSEQLSRQLQIPRVDDAVAIIFSSGFGMIVGAAVGAIHGPVTGALGGTLIGVVVLQALDCVVRLDRAALSGLLAATVPPPPPPSPCIPEPTLHLRPTACARRSPRRSRRLCSRFRRWRACCCSTCWTRWRAGWCWASWPGGLPAIANPETSREALRRDCDCMPELRGSRPLGGQRLERSLHRGVHRGLVSGLRGALLVLAMGAARRGGAPRRVEQWPWRRCAARRAACRSRRRPT